MSKAKAEPVRREVWSCRSQNQPVNVEPVRYICPVKSFQLGDKPRRRLWGAAPSRRSRIKESDISWRRKKAIFVFLPLSLMSD